MENREAIEWLKGCVVAYEVDNKGKPNGNVTCELIQEVIDMAISALEKQETAKIVIGKSKGGVTLWHECSKCGEPVDAKDMFCSGCGRKLIPLPEPYTEEKA